MAIRKHRPMANFAAHLNPICVIRDRAFEIADGEVNHDNNHIADERKFLVYGRLWMILLALWDEMSNQLDEGCPSFEDQLHAAFNADIEDVLVAMYG